MENKKKIIGMVLIIILIIALIAVTILYNNFSETQLNLLTEESNKLIQQDLINEEIDEEIKTQKDYAVVEKTIKEYLSNQGRGGAGHPHRGGPGGPAGGRHPPGPLGHGADGPGTAEHLCGPGKAHRGTVRLLPHGGPERDGPAPVLCSGADTAAVSRAAP